SPPSFAEQHGEQLPAYSATSAGATPAPVNINAAFEALSLSDGPQNPDANTCLAHLKLLFAIHSLKTDIGYTDGLWGIADASIEGLTDAQEEKRLKAVNPDERMAALSRLREKRWAIFLARAVDRYEAWWTTLPGEPLKGYL